MQEANLWEQAREALAGIVDIASQYGSKGADIHFMHGDDYAPSMQVNVLACFTRTSISNNCHVVEVRGPSPLQPSRPRRHVAFICIYGNVLTHSSGEDTPTGAKLGQIIDHYLPLIEGERSTHEPITVLVVTDGLPSQLRSIRACGLLLTVLNYACSRPSGSRESDR